ncbi:F-box/LRR-repeat protein 4 [Malania oleifera]|uniref:F-box/LRR-repeat protein 4 n=1 Tax=Malania oleifera TaxID=397392 RepID=UPI0025AE564F|nr:F-box/LRR-repeat protein 4 [Malania oleifera]
MDAILCDELLLEIFLRLPPPSYSAVPLVSKRWLRLHRSSTTTLALRFPTPIPSLLPSIAASLSLYPFLSSLSVVSSSSDSSEDGGAFSDRLLLAVSSSCSRLRHLRFLAGPVSVYSLLSLSASCTHLTSLNITLFRPLRLRWLASFRSLKDLSFCICTAGDDVPGEFDSEEDRTDLLLGKFDTAELGLESLSLSGIRAGDRALGWVWRNCKKLRKLRLRSCEGIGDEGSFSSFIKCLQGLQEVELRTSRTIVNGVLLKLAENCSSLNSLLVYDGGSKEGLLQFINHCRCKFNLRRLDFRLPLDLDNHHLLAAAESFRGLSSLSLQSCCLVTGEGLKTLGLALNSRLEELALINCDVLEREPGLLTTLGQSLRQLKKLDLSHNEMLLDKEFVSMLVSCKGLVDLRVRGCKSLTNAAIVSLFKSCKLLESVDIMHCCGIEVEAVEMFVVNSPRLRRVWVEESKISDAARTWALRKSVEVMV